ncbi:MAG TPA: TadE/TadG family type IV pilus assembly protein [Candidatus Dormibacteraeota bacterium]|nr:TadE/TadG family type IV pilus assembly protein [Candidatus Dormibacteraeota bacterium]
MTELALVLPILLILVLGIGDLGRVFAVGVMTESAARDAAEIVAQQYLIDYPLAAPSSAPSGYYAGLHLKGARAVCAELKSLPNTVATGVICSGMPLMFVCVHDGVDDACSTEPFGDPVPARCDQLDLVQHPITNALPGGTETSRFVEVRLCYDFTPLTHSLFFVVPEIYMQQTRTFTVADY